eukprot:3168153-Rhodomonas_salina.1
MSRIRAVTPLVCLIRSALGTVPAARRGSGMPHDSDSNGIRHCPGLSDRSTRRRRGVACLGIGSRILRLAMMP